MKIESLVNEDSNERYMNYSNESLLKILFDMVEKYGTKADAEQFIIDHIKYTSFRELFIDNLIKEKNYHKVIELAIEAEKQDQQFAGLVSKWKKMRYNAYKELSLKEEQQKLAKELFFNGDFDYYKELKELNNDDEELFYNHLKNELKKDNDWYRRNLYLKLIEEEKDVEEIIEFVRNNPENIEGYAEILVEKYKEEVITIYKKFIQTATSLSSNRKSYQEVCRKIKRYKKIAGNEMQKEIVNELSALYKKRPAFIDELSKIR